MQTTIDLPDDLRHRVKPRADMRRLTVAQFIVEAVERRLACRPLSIGGPDAPPLGVLIAEQIDEAMFG
jgi:hypothetical protein